MESEDALALRALLLQQEVATLATLHAGEPAVSMTPYALLGATGEFVLHVSRLASHTQDLQRHAGVSLLVMGERRAGQPAQALPRVAIGGEARFCAADDAAHATARAAYLERFPQSAPMFGFGDFSLVLVAPRSVRYVAGFGQAWTLSPGRLAALLRGATGDAGAV